MSAPLPANEAERLEALRSYEILDTPPEAAFNRITVLAAQLFRVPIALVSIVDAERQWFKACFGSDLRETSRELSFCAYTILSNQPMVVPDTRLDPRFVENRLVTEPPCIRFYAGAPLATPEGHNLGSLCIIDTKPRQVFTGEEQVMLNDLAAIVVDELLLRRTARDLRDSEAALRQTLREKSQLATAVTNISSGVVITDPHQPDHPIVYANPGFRELTGYSSEEVVGHNCRFLQGTDTNPITVQAMRDAIANRVSFRDTLVNYRADGTEFINELQINPVWDENGELLSFVGLINDVTEREQAREILEQTVQERTADLADSQIEILTRLARAAEFRDDMTGQHTQRVGKTAALMGQALGLPDEHISLISQAAPLHDVGKVAISDLILLKPDKLTDDEFEIMKSHTQIGALLLSQGRSEVVQMAERIAAAHQERWDGKGYPQGLSGEEIPLEARIIAIADVFDALTHDRPYKKAWPIAEAVAEISRQSGRQFDPHLVDIFLTLPHSELVDLPEANLSEANAAEAELSELSTSSLQYTNRI